MENRHIICNPRLVLPSDLLIAQRNTDVRPRIISFDFRNFPEAPSVVEPHAEPRTNSITQAQPDSSKRAIGRFPREAMHTGYSTGIEESNELELILRSPLPEPV